MPAPKRPARGRRKVKKNIAVGQAHIKTSFNNTIVSLTDPEGNVIAWESAGGAGFKGSRKSTPFAAQVTADAAARKGMEQGLQKKHARHDYARASRQSGSTGQKLLSRLESRLDNVLVRLGFAGSRRQARQLVRHGHWTVNGRRVDIPSYQVRPGEVIAVKAGTPAEQVIRDATELTGQVPAWLQADHDAL